MLDVNIHEYLSAEELQALTQFKTKSVKKENT